MWYGDSVPQNGQSSFCLPGFHSACAPQAGHSCFSSAETGEDISYDMYAFNASREILHDDPIFLPFRSPDSSTVITSASDTPKPRAASRRGEHPGPPRAPRRSGGRNRRHDRRRSVSAHEAVTQHLLRQPKTNGKLRGRARGTGATRTRLEALAHLILHEVVQVADGGHTRPRVARP